MSVLILFLAVLGWLLVSAVVALLVGAGIRECNERDTGELHLPWAE